MSSSEKSRILNFNVGVLGHIDSGKTSLSKVLSTTASTASFDKNPQSRERGITLDLGFSSFAVQLPEQLKEEPYDILQFTLVDCPGHASLIKTIIGGAQIIDLMILVVDINKGIQTQTAECLIIGQITCDKMIVVLNKIDLIPEAKRAQQIEKMKKRLSKTLESTKFSGSPIVAVAAKPDGGDDTQIEALGVQELADLLSSQAYVPKRNTSGPFLFAVDHCFSVRGQGTVMTGTILQGSVALNDNIEIPSMKVVKKVKSIQMFRQPVVKAFQGDRVGICVTQFDPKLLERGLVCTPSTVPTIVAGIMSVEKIHYYKTAVSSKAKFHITVGHETVMGKAQFFGLPASENPDAAVDQKSSFDFSKEYVFQEELLGISKEKDKEKENSFPENPTQTVNPNFQFAVLELEKPVTCPHESLVIGSRLDTDIHLNTCRLAFHGKLLNMITEKSYDEVVLPKLRIFKNKSRVGEVERVVDEYSVVGKGLFKKETNIQLFLNLKVTLSTGETGVIEGSFGQSGKFKVRIPAGLSPETFNSLSAFHKKKGKGKPATATGDEKEKASPVKIILNFKSGLGSFVIAGFCYAAYRNRGNVVKYLEKTDSFNVGKELKEVLETSPDNSLDYVAIRGDAMASQFPLESNNVPKVRPLIQRITLHEHKVEWSRSSRLWYNTRRTVSTVVNSVPFSLNSPNSRIKVNIDEPLNASGLDYNIVYDKYEPVNASVSENLVQWASGEKTKGIQTVEEAILEGTTLTAVGKLTLTNGKLKIAQPGDSREYFLSKLPLDGIIREKKNSSRILKYVTVAFSVTGGILLLLWLYKKWRRRREQVVHFEANRVEVNMDFQGAEAADEQSCVICLARRRNVVILDCGHICACRVCATQIHTCPVCRAEIIRLVPTYQS